MSVFKICLFSNCWLCFSLVWLYSQVLSSCAGKDDHQQQTPNYILQLSNYSEKACSFFHGSSKIPRAESHFWVPSHVLQTEARGKHSQTGLILELVGYTSPNQTTWTEKQVKDTSSRTQKRGGSALLQRKIGGGVQTKQQMSTTVFKAFSIVFDREQDIHECLLLLMPLVLWRREDMVTLGREPLNNDVKCESMTSSS